jgi:hypothetical protein
MDDVPIGASPIPENCPQGIKKHYNEMKQHEGRIEFFRAYFNVLV